MSLNKSQKQEELKTMKTWKKNLIISLLKSKESRAELFNDNNNNGISDIRNISEEEKEYIRKLVRVLNDKEEHSLYDRDDLDYYGIIDIENFFDEASQEDYYKPIFAKRFHKGNYKHYESNGDIEKRLSVYQYLNKINRIYMIW